MRSVIFEVTDPNTVLVATDKGIITLDTLLNEVSSLYAWAVKWSTLDGQHLGISFHDSFKSAQTFITERSEAVAEGSPKLVEISASLDECIKTKGFCDTKLTCFEDAITYSVENDS